MTSKRVLIVDDEFLTRISLADFLQEMGYIVTSVGGGAEAIALQRTEAFDVCIVDIRMPGISGIQTLLALHCIAPQSRYLIYTGSPHFTLPADLENIGIIEYDIVRKPLLDMRVFVDLIEAPPPKPAPTAEG